MNNDTLNVFRVSGTQKSHFSVTFDKAPAQSAFPGHDHPYYEFFLLLEGDVEMNIPAASSSGRKLRMRGRGLGPESKRGDEYVNVVISVPRPEELSEEQLAHWKALAQLAEK